ncbi:MAG: heavy metal-associated domain-containing protein [Acetobacterium sp.]|nr:heavy metal-associated domain-containing protein [Acetobacterium sp.]
MKEFALQVDGIMCHKCVKKITDTLLDKDGIEDVGVSEDFSTVTVKLDENKITALQIGSIIEKIEDKSFKIIN